MTNWPIKTLGDVCDFVSGSVTPQKGITYQVFSVPSFDSGNPEKLDGSEIKSSKRPVEPGDVLLCKINPRINRVWRVDRFSKDIQIASTEWIALRSRGEVLDVFLQYILQAPAARKLMIESVTGATGSHTRAKYEIVEELQFSVPPLEEQKRIVELLDAATSRVTELTACYEQARTHANDLLESSFLELFAEAFESHPKRKMGEVLQIARGGSPRPISEFITNSPKGVNWIKIGDASSSTKYIYETAQKIKPEGVSRSRMVYPGDFLLSNSMSFGRPYIMKTEGCIHDGWLVLHDSKGDLDQDFLFYLLSSRFMYERFSQLAAGSTVQNLNSALVSSVEIPVPPLNVQRKIAEKARVLEENVARLNEVSKLRLQLAKELRQSILEAAFAGDL